MPRQRRKTKKNIPKKMTEATPNSLEDKINLKNKAEKALAKAKSLNRPVKFLKQGETFIQYKFKR